MTARDDRPQTEKKHPDRWERDLNPDRLEGQNIGAESPDAAPRFLEAADIKGVTRLLTDFAQDELREIPVVPEGERLRQGATYVDLLDPLRRPFQATAEHRAEPDHWYVPKKYTPYPYWNRLTGAREPERRI